MAGKEAGMASKYSSHKTQSEKVRKMKRKTWPLGIYFLNQSYILIAGGASDHPRHSLDTQPPCWLVWPVECRNQVDNHGQEDVP